MRFAPHSLLALLLMFAGPVVAARRPPALPPLPVLELPGATPEIDALIAGQPVRLTVDLGGDPLVQLGPDAAARLQLASITRADAGQVARGSFRVAVGQVTVAVPFTREILNIAGRNSMVQVLTPKAAPDGQTLGSDGVIGLPLLPHSEVKLVYRPATPQDRLTMVNGGSSNRSDSLAFDWPLPRQPSIEVQLHQRRPVSVASVAAASRLAAAGGGRLTGPVRQVEIAFGVARPVRSLHLARPLTIAGVSVRIMDVRLFDWAGKAELPPDSDAGEGALVTGKRGRQRGWPILKLGQDVLDRCASLTWKRDPSDRRRGHIELRCPAIF